MNNLGYAMPFLWLAIVVGATGLSVLAVLYAAHKYLSRRRTR